MSENIDSLFRERVFYDRLRDQIYFLIFIVLGFMLLFQLTTDFNIFSFSIFDLLLLGLFIIAALGFQILLNLIYDRYSKFQMSTKLKSVKSISELQENLEYLLDQRFYQNKTSGVLETMDKNYKIIESLDEIDNLEELHTITSISKEKTFYYQFTSSIGTYCRIEQNLVKPILRYLDVDIGLIPGTNTVEPANQLILGLKGYYILIDSQGEE